MITSQIVRDSMNRTVKAATARKAAEKAGAEADYIAVLEDAWRVAAETMSANLEANGFRV